MTRTVLALAALALSVAPVAAADDAFDALEPVAEAELDAARGGFLVEGGRVASLGAEVVTLVQGREVLRTTLSATPGSLKVVEQAGSGLVAADAAALQAAARRGVDVRGLDGERVFFVGDRTAVAHQITDGAIRNFVVNVADGLEIVQQVRIDVALDGDAFRQDQISLSGLRIALDQADLVRAGFR